MCSVLGSRLPTGRGGRLGCCFPFCSVTVCMGGVGAGGQSGLHEHRITGLSSDRSPRAQEPGPYQVQGRGTLSDSSSVWIRPVLREWICPLVCGSRFGYVWTSWWWEWGCRSSLKRHIPEPPLQRLHSSRGDRTPGICFWHIWIQVVWGDLKLRNASVQWACVFRLERDNRLPRWLSPASEARRGEVIVQSQRSPNVSLQERR